MKRFMALILALAMLLTCIPATKVSAAGLTDEERETVMEAFREEAGLTDEELETVMEAFREEREERKENQKILNRMSIFTYLWMFAWGLDVWLHTKVIATDKDIDFVPEPDDLCWRYLDNAEVVDEYLDRSFRQVVLGNYSDEEITVLGTSMQVLLAFSGLDVLCDIRDVTADAVNWEDTPEHKMNTVVDVIAVIPMVGVLKHTDEIQELLKSGEDILYLFRVEGKVLAVAGAGAGTGTTVVDMGTDGLKLFDSLGKSAADTTMKIFSDISPVEEAFDAGLKAAMRSADEAGEGLQAAAKSAEEIEEAVKESLKVAARSSDKAAKLLEIYSSDELREMIKAADGIFDNFHFKNFDSLKSYMNARQGKMNGYAWHHLVEQNQRLIWNSGFDVRDINSVRNVIHIPHGSGTLHQAITDMFARPYGDLTDGLPLRKYLSKIGMSFDEQLELNLGMLMSLTDGYILPTDMGWVYVQKGMTLTEVFPDVDLVHIPESLVESGRVFDLIPDYLDWVDAQ